MSVEVTVTLITTGGLILVALIGVWVEQVRTRRKAQTVVTAVTPNGGESMRDAVNRIERDVREVRVEQNRQGQRLAAVEALQSQQLLGRRADGG